MNFVTIDTDAAGRPCFDLESDGQPVRKFKPTKAGLRQLGQAIAATGEPSFLSSSSLDFPGEYGVAMLADEIFSTILKAMRSARRGR